MDTIFEKSLIKYCVDTFHSTEYALQIIELIKKGVVNPVNKECFFEPNKYVCTKDISVLELLKNPFSFNIPLDITVFPMERHLADLSLFVWNLQNLKAGEITLKDISVLLYILWETTTKNYADMLLTQFIRTLVTNKESDITIVLYDYLGMCHQVLKWDNKEYQARFRRAPLYAKCTPEKVADFYKVVFKAIAGVTSIKKNFRYPKIIFMNSKLTKLDKILFKFLKTPDVEEDFRAELELFDVLQSRETGRITDYIYSRTKERPLLRRLSRIAGKYSTNRRKTVYWVDAALAECHRLIQNNSLVTYEYYNPFAVKYDIVPCFSEVCIDFQAFKELYKDRPLVDWKDLFREVYLAAQTINNMRRKLVLVEDSEMLPLNVSILDMEMDKDPYVMNYIQETTENLESTYMDIYTYKIRNYVGYDEYRPCAIKKGVV